MKGYQAERNNWAYLGEVKLHSLRVHHFLHLGRVEYAVTASISIRFDFVLVLVFGRTILAVGDLSVVSPNLSSLTTYTHKTAYSPCFYPHPSHHPPSYLPVHPQE